MAIRMLRLVFSIKLLLAITLIIGFAYISPMLDQYIAWLTYNSKTSFFYGESAYWCKLIYNAVPVIVFLLIALPLLVFCHKDKKTLPNIKKSIITLYLSLCIGPGLVINVVLKNHWGRARPYQVLRDGKQFTPVYQPHFMYKSYNSFPSGHASIGFFLGVPFWLLYRCKSAVMIGIIGGISIGTVRILQGGHYLSDVLFSGLIVWLVTIIVIYVIDKIYHEGSFFE